MREREDPIRPSSGCKKKLGISWGRQKNGQEENLSRKTFFPPQPSWDCKRADKTETGLTLCRVLFLRASWKRRCLLVNEQLFHHVYVFFYAYARAWSLLGFEANEELWAPKLASFSLVKRRCVSEKIKCVLFLNLQVVLGRRGNPGHYWREGGRPGFLSVRREEHCGDKIGRGGFIEHSR